MSTKESNYITKKALDDPILNKLSDLSKELTGIGFSILFPQANGWIESQPGTPLPQPEFCEIMQSSPDGPKHCKACHVLIAVAACSNGFKEHRCHAGVCVFSAPVSHIDEDIVAVFTSCVFTQESQANRWKETKKRAEKLGIDTKLLKEAYTSLPVLSQEQAQIMRSIMEIITEAVRGVHKRLLLEEELRDQKQRGETQNVIQQEVETVLKSGVLDDSGNVQKRLQKTNRSPIVMNVVADLVTRKPNMHFSVSEIAAAARMTPNHFSTTFHQHLGQSFADFLSEKRIALAKTLLCDLTLNIGEVARMSGYDDAGYFGRIFKRKTGKTPGAWRTSLTVD